MAALLPLFFSPGEIDSKKKEIFFMLRLTVQSQLKQRTTQLF
jgi:hypothetical protein